MTAARSPARPPAALADRVRAALAGEGPNREVAMFGGLSFMVRERLVVAVRGDDRLLVRIDPARRAEALARPGARPATMGADRPMGDAWVDVGAEGLATDADVTSWLAVALASDAGGAAGPGVSGPRSGGRASRGRR